MRTLLKKAKSQAGASITFALLLFLVCAVISSVVIVAATAVGGRASQLAAMDQRYYAVNSAAELVRDVLEGQTVAVTTITETTVTRNQDGTDVTDPDGEPAEPDYEVTLDGEEIELDAAKNLLLTAAALRLTLDEEDENYPDTLPTPLSLTADGGEEGPATDALEVEITSELDGEALRLRIANVNTARGVYALALTFRADKAVSQDTRTTAGTPVYTGASEGKVLYTVDEKTVSETKTTFHWKLVELKTLAATETEKESE